MLGSPDWGVYMHQIEIKGVSEYSVYLSRIDERTSTGAGLHSMGMSNTQHLKFGIIVWHAKLDCTQQAFLSPGNYFLHVNQHNTPILCIKMVEVTL